MIIFTKFLARTGNSARIKALTPVRGEGCYIDHDETLSMIDNHRAACDKLSRKLHWQDSHYLHGEMPGGFVFIACDIIEPHTHHNKLWPHVGTTEHLDRQDARISLVMEDSPLQD